MSAIYKPIIAKAEFAGHTFEEIRFAMNLKYGIDDFFKILNGEKNGTNAREFLTRLAKEAEETENDEQ